MQTTSKNVCDLGAQGDGKTLNTAILQQAIESLHQAGGGTLHFPPGVYLTGALFLRSNITLHLARGATLLGSASMEHYQPLPAGAPPHEAGSQALLMALDQHHIGISGEGCIDGQGRALAEDGERLSRAGKLPPITGKYAYLPELYRPMLINFARCQDVTIQGVELRDGSCWIQQYLDCERLVLRGLRIQSFAYWNNDGIDIVDCRQVRITDCHIESADDAICFKSISKPCMDVVVSNCNIRTHANGIKFGSFTYAGFLNFAISNITMRGSGHSGIALECVDGGLVENVVISNITMRNLHHGIFMRQAGRYRTARDSNNPRHVQPGGFRNIQLSNIIAQLAEEKPDPNAPLPAPQARAAHNPFPCHITGLPGFPLENITLSDITFITPGGGSHDIAHIPQEKWGDIPENPKDYPEYNMLGELPAFGWYFRHVKNLTLRNLQVLAHHPDDRAALVLDDVHDADITGFKSPAPRQAPAVMVARKSSDIRLHACRLPEGAGKLLETID